MKMTKILIQIKKYVKNKYFPVVFADPQEDGFDNETKYRFKSEMSKKNLYFFNS